MHKEFQRNWCKNLEWLAYLGEPILYDGGLFVNRTPEDWEFAKLHKLKELTIV